jgi:dihydroflavonol-4-reductase
VEIQTLSKSISFAYAQPFDLMIAVTGANGLLGSYIIRELAEKNPPVVAIARTNSSLDIFSAFGDRIIRRVADVQDVSSLTAVLKDVHTVIHTAAMVSFNPRKAKKIIEINAGGTGNVIDVCLQLSIPKLIHVSSIAALGRQKNGPFIDEESKWADTDLNSDYAVSKYLAELEVFRGKEEGLKVSIVNPSIILAPADWTKSSAQVFRYVWDERMFYTGGSLNYVDVRDVVTIIMALSDGDFDGQKFIANAGSVSLLEFLTAVAIRFGKRPPRVQVGSPWTGIYGWLEEVRSFLTSTEPLVTRQSVRLAAEKFLYSNEKVKEKLGIKFRTLEESLDWCCGEYLRKINTNK